MNPNCPDEEGPDFDFSAAPLITTTAAGRDLIVIPQKSGVIWALDPDKGGEVVWQYRYGQGSGLGGQWGAAADGVNAYIGTGDAFSPNPGGHARRESGDGQARMVRASAAEAVRHGTRLLGLASRGDLGDPRRGLLGGRATVACALTRVRTARLFGRSIRNRPFKTVNGVEANGGTMDASGVVVSGGMLYVNSGYGGLVGRAGNVLLAFRVE